MDKIVQFIINRRKYDPKRKCTQAILGEKTGLGTRSIQRIESGTLTTRELILIADVLEFDVILLPKEADIFTA